METLNLIAAYNFEPDFCAHCGKKAIHHDAPMGHVNYCLRRSYHCSCGLSYQRATTRSILEAAERSEGDLHILPTSRRGEDQTSNGKDSEAVA